MKKIVLLIYLICFNIYSQKTEPVTKVVYKYFVNKSDAELSNIGLLIKKEQENGKATLLFNNNKAYYSLSTPASAYSFVFGPTRIYDFNINKVFKIIETGPMPEIKIAEKIKDKKWDLYPDKKVINGLTCYKAVHSFTEKSKEKNGIVKDVTFTYIAWYTPEIPTLSGPNIYYGLPGLIMEVTDLKGNALLVESISKNVNYDWTQLSVFDNYKEISQDDYNKKMDSFLKQANSN